MSLRVNHTSLRNPPQAWRSRGWLVASNQSRLDEAFMNAALVEAQAAFVQGEVPVGACLVQGGGIVSTAHNETRTRNSPLAHAEMLCLERAAQALGGWRLLDSTLYVTCEPCPMCAGAVLQARVKRLVYGAKQPRVGADGSWISMFPRSEDTTASSSWDACYRPERPPPTEPHPFHPNIQVTRGVLQEECSAILRLFFKERREVGRQSIDDQ